MTSPSLPFVALMTMSLALSGGLAAADTQPAPHPSDEGRHHDGGGNAASDAMVTEIIHLAVDEVRQAESGGQGQGQPVASDLERFLAKVPDIVADWPAAGKISFDPKTNSVSITSTPASIVEVKRMLQGFGPNSTQVLIEARFVEVSDDAAKELGIAWEGGGNRGDPLGGTPTNGLVPPATAASGATVGTGDGTDSARLASSGLLTQVLIAPGDLLKFKATISALRAEGKAEVLWSPKILARNHALGVIEVRRNIPYISGYQNSGVNSNQVPGATNHGIDNGVSGISTVVPVFTTDYEGINLEIRPSVAAHSDIITLTLASTLREMTRKPVISDADNPNANATGAVTPKPIQPPPLFDTRRLITALHIRNGSTAVLGVLTCDEKGPSDTAGIPGSSRTPTVDSLFPHHRHLDQRSDLLILVTASLIDPASTRADDEVRHLRDTVQMTLPAETPQAEAKQQP